MRGLERRAKYLIFALDEGWVLLVHLGMSGRITVVEEGRTSGVPFHHHVEPLAGHGPHDHVLIEFEGGARLVYTDPRRFGFMDLVKEVDLSDHPGYPTSVRNRSMRAGRPRCGRIRSCIERSRSSQRSSSTHAGRRWEHLRL